MGRVTVSSAGVVWTSEAVAETYLEFFRSRGHLEVPSSSLVPASDPTVLLTTAGVQQFVPYVLGQRPPPSPRLCSLQKCARTTDIDKVGDGRHLTFFEMLGNFSIGDYFKEQMIRWAWELVTTGFRMPADRLWVTVHPTDDEAVAIWRSIGLPHDRIVPDESNFWGPPGASGPCGPDTELYYDRGAAYGCGRESCAPGCDCDRYLEFWNLVFMQYSQDAQGNRSPLSERNIDTGLGLERLTSILQDTPSVYETDLFLPIIGGVETLCGARYGADEAQDYALRVLADHGRAMTFLVGDGVRPSNEGRGYVLRRLVRRGVRYGRKLGIDRPFLADLADIVIARMKDRYPALDATHADIEGILRTEEQRFLSTLQAGLNLLDRWIEEARAAGATELSGANVFRLYDTFGFPRELSQEIAAEAGLGVGLEEIEREMAAQRERSRKAARFGGERSVREASDVMSQPPTLFVGYERLETQSPILAIGADGAEAATLHEGEAGTIVLAETPFYAEGGGQVGDTGEIVCGSSRFQVEDTQHDAAGHVLHIGRVVTGELAVGEQAEVGVDAERRRDIMGHHSVTHLLHRSLQTVLGPHAIQAGSLVAPHVARFDFPHERPVDEARLEEVESLVNSQITADLPVRIEELSFDEAVRQGAAAFFGEKYGDHVRVVSMGEFSKELCAGTHVSRTGELGAAFIVAESGIGTGMRRIEMICGRPAYRYARTRNQQVASLAARLGTTPEGLIERVEGLLAELREARRERAGLESALAQQQAQDLAQQVRTVLGVPVLAARVQAPSMDALLGIKDVLRERLPSGVLVLGAVIEERPQFVVSVSQDLIHAGFDAASIIKEVAAATGGSGGGRPELARAGGRDPAKLDAALALAEDIVRGRAER